MKLNRYLEHKAMPSLLKNLFTCNLSSNSAKRLLSFLIPISFFVIALIYVRLANVFEYNIDEGMYTMRAYLHLKGYALYKQIWMDQPPLLVLMLSGLFKIFGPSIYLARALIILFSTMLLWAVYRIISKTQNTLSALWVVAAIILSSYYLQYSIAVVSTIPTIALAMLSIYGMLLYQESHKKRYLIFSGCMFAFALMIRFFAVIFLPGIIVEMLIFEWKKASGKNALARSMTAIMWWFVAFSAVAAYIAFVAMSIDFSQIIQPYILARKLPIADRQSITTFLMKGQDILPWFIRAYDVVLLALGAFLFVKQDQRKFFLVPLINFVFGFLILTNHRPRWDHHQLFIIVSLCWLASFSVYALCEWIRAAEWKNKNKQLNRRTILAIFYISSALLLFIITIPSKYSRLYQLAQTQLPGNNQITALVKRYSKETHLVVTDRPIFAFYAGLPAHPYLATVSPKRIFCGLLTAKDYINIIQKEQPELILFAYYPSTLYREVAPFIQKGYELEYENTNTQQRLYVLKRIKEEISGR